MHKPPFSCLTVHQDLARKPSFSWLAGHFTMLPDSASGLAESVALLEDASFQMATPLFSSIILFQTTQPLLSH